MSRSDADRFASRPQGLTRGSARRASFLLLATLALAGCSGEAKVAHESVRPVKAMVIGEADRAVPHVSTTSP